MENLVWELIDHFPQKLENYVNFERTSLQVDENVEMALECDEPSQERKYYLDFVSLAIGECSKLIICLRRARSSQEAPWKIS